MEQPYIDSLMEQPYIKSIRKQVEIEKAKDGYTDKSEFILVEYYSDTTEDQYKSLLEYLLANFDSNFIDLVITGDTNINILKDVLRTQYGVLLTTPLDPLETPEMPFLERKSVTYFLLKRKDPQDIREPLPASVLEDMRLSRYSGGNPYHQEMSK